MERFPFNARQKRMANKLRMAGRQKIHNFHPNKNNSVSAIAETFAEEMKTHTKLMLYGYGILATVICMDLEHGRLQFDVFSLLRVVLYIYFGIRIPTVMKTTYMFPVWGWGSFVLCLLAIGFGPIVPLRVFPWIIYLSIVGIIGFGSYLLLLDPDVRYFRTKMSSIGTTSEQAANGKTPEAPKPPH